MRRPAVPRRAVVANRESSLRELPGYVNALGLKGTSQQVRASWVVLTFPYIEQLAPANAKKANELAKEFLNVWINNNDPNSSRR